MSEVDEPSSRCDGFVPVDEANRLIADEDHGVGAQVVVRDDFVAVGQRGPGGRVVATPDQLARPGDPGLGKAERAANGPFPPEIGDYLPALFVQAEIPRGSIEADLLERLKQLMDVFRTSVQRSAHRRANAPDPCGLRASTQVLLDGGRWFRVTFHVKHASATRVRSERGGRGS